MDDTQADRADFDTAGQAVRQAVDLAKAVGATLELVSAYEPVPAQRLREERRDAVVALGIGRRLREIVEEADLRAVL